MEVRSSIGSVLLSYDEWEAFRNRHYRLKLLAFRLVTAREEEEKEQLMETIRKYLNEEL